MSTKATVAWDAKTDTFHLYEELMDGRLWLEAEVDEFRAGRQGQPGRMTVCIPLPPEFIKKVLRPEYRKYAPTPAQRKRREAQARKNIERFLREMEKRNARQKESDPPAARATAARRPGGRRPRGTPGRGGPSGGGRGGRS
ncbi:MAG TPA: hypothetical protein VGB42_02200 [Candidatus Thermoplasmatota archaeon]